MTDAGLDDQELIARVAAAEVGALEMLYDRYSALVYSISLYIVNDADTAEEITQDVFVQLWNKASLYHPDKGKVISWLTSLTRNRSIDVIRRVKIRAEGHSVEWGEEITPFVSQDGSGPEQTVEIVQQREKLLQVIEMLPIEQRRVLALAYFYGYSHQQIADILNEPLGTVKTRLRMAVIRLRDLLKPSLVNME